MVLTFKSTVVESYSLTGVDDAGRARRVTAVKESGNSYWDLELRHPSGQTWTERFHGSEGEVPSAMAGLLRQKDWAFKEDRQRGDRPAEEPYDPSRPISINAPISRWR